MCHVKEWGNVLREVQRVIKPGGWLWVYVSRKAEYWDLTDGIRNKVTPKDAEELKEFLLRSGWPIGKIYFILDSFFVPLRINFTAEQMESNLKRLGFGNIRILDEDLYSTETIKEKTGLRLIAQKE